MGINMFEGARRIAKLIAAFWVGGWIIAAFTVSPRVSVIYGVYWPESAPTIITNDCPYDAASEIQYLETHSGTKVRLELCFLPQPTNDGKQAIPYRLDASNGTWWGGKKYSLEVNEYTTRVAQSFRMTEAEQAWIDKRWLTELLKMIGQGFLVALGGLVAFSAFVWAVGWIVRGFMGIPRGADSRE